MDAGAETKEKTDKKKTIKKKGGTNSKKKTFYALVTFTRVNRIKTIAMSTLDHQSQTYRSSSKLYNPQLCNLPYQPLPQRSHSPPPPWFHSFHKDLHKVLLRPHRVNLHKVANSIPSLRPFQKKTRNKKKKLSRKEQVTAAAPPPPPPPPIPPTLTPESYTTPPDTPNRERLRGSPFGPKGDALLDLSLIHI